MNWTWEGGPANQTTFGIEYGEILAEGIEEGMLYLEMLQGYGKFCEGCGNWRLTTVTDVNEIGGEPDEKLLMAYDLCDECRKEVLRDRLRRNW